MTKIEWTRGDDGSPGKTWNPVTGCTKVTAGCKNCYAEAVAERFWGRQYPARAGFTEVWVHPSRLDTPLRWTKPCRIFVNSMSDLFHENVDSEFIAAIFGVMALSPQHTFQVLTKRADRMREWMKEINQDRGGLANCLAAAYVTKPEIARQWPLDSERAVAAARRGWPLPNVWLGVSVENQETADERGPLLRHTPAAVRFLSVEPLLGPVNLGLLPAHARPHVAPHDRFDWIIVGGESGVGARPCDVAWIRSIVAQCKAAGLSVFVKQLGAKPHVEDPLDLREWRASSRWRACKCGKWAGTLRDRKGGDITEFPEDLRAREFPKESA